MNSKSYFAENTDNDKSTIVHSSSILYPVIVQVQSTRVSVHQVAGGSVVTTQKMSYYVMWMGCGGWL